MDTIKLTIDPIKFDNDIIDEVNIFINGRNLSEIIGDIFVGLPPEVVFFPSRHLLDKPHPWFKENDHPVIYSCGGCGMHDCTGVLVTITIRDDAIIWSDFDYQVAGLSQSPDLNEGLTFTFNRKQYESELSRKYVVKREELLHYED